MWGSVKWTSINTLCVNGLNTYLNLSCWLFVIRFLWNIGESAMILVDAGVTVGYVFLTGGSICWFCWLKASRSTGSSGRSWRVSACMNMIPHSPDGLLITNGNIYLSFCCSVSWMCYSCFFRDKFDIKTLLSCRFSNIFHNFHHLFNLKRSQLQFCKTIDRLAQHQE